ncbi:MAG: hypothetical protein WD066_14070 [Planctomycetaceae bacterium]
MSQIVRSSIILLAEEDDANILVIPSDRDSFMVTVKEAVKACRAHGHQLEFRNQLEDLLEELHGWLQERKDKVHASYLSIRDNGLLFVVALKESRFDQAFADELTNLDLSIATSDQYSLIDLDVMAVSKVSHGSLQAFLSSGEVYSYVK